MAVQKGDLQERLRDLWWIRVPLAVRRLGARPLLVLVDGLAVAVWPRVAAFLSPLVLFLGLLLGGLHPGFDQVFSQSWIVLLPAVLLGVFSGHLGAFFLVGYAFGDFFLWHTEWTFRGSFLQNLLRVRIPLLIQYGLLAFMTTGVPLATKTLLVQLRPPSTLPRPVRRALAVAGHLVLTLLLVYLWIQIVPILIRPVFTWTGGGPPVDAMEILQQRSWPLLLVAGVASLARMGLQTVVAAGAEERAALEALEERLQAAPPVTAVAARLPLPVLMAGTAVWSTLMLAGMLEAWWDGLLLGAVIVGLQVARAGIIGAPLRPWAQFVSRIPVPLRLAAGIVVVAVLSRVALGTLMARTNSFRPILLVTILALLVFYLLDPLHPQLRVKEE
jgi:hypothetical protein